MRANWLPIAAVAGLLLGWFGWASWRAAQQDELDWQDIRRWAASHRLDTKRRPQMLEWSGRGEAMAHYARAAVVADRAGDIDPPQGSADGARVRGFVAAMRPALDHLLAGARAPQRRVPTVAELAEDDEALQVLPLCRVAKAACLGARAEFERGTPSGGIDLLLATLAMAVDMCATPALVAELAGVVWIDGVVERLDEVTLRSLPEHELQRLADALAKVDAAVPPTLTGSTGEVLFMFDAFEQPQPVGQRLLGALTGFGVQDCAPLLRQRIDQIDVLAALEDAPWPDRERVYRETRIRGDARLARLFAVEHRPQELQKRCACDRWRQLRLALGVHLGTGPGRLPDPLGRGELVVTRSEDAIAVQRTEAIPASALDGDAPPTLRVIRPRDR